MTSTYLVVAGVDGSEGGHRALARAVQEAATRGGTVQAVNAWSSTSRPSRGIRRPS